MEIALRPGGKKRVKGQCPLRSPEAAPLVGFGATPQLFLVKSIQREQPTKGAGSEASLPVTLRVLRRAPKLLYRPTVQCRAKWARPHSLPAPISANKTQPEDSQHPPAGFQISADPSFAHLPYTKSAPEASAASGAKIMRKKCERDRKPSSVEGRSSIQT